MNIGAWIVSDQFGNVVPVSSQGQLDLAATGLNEVLQNILVICNTRVGSVMLDRRFGLSYKFLDAPQNAAELIIISEVCAGISRFEPRARFKGIRFAPGGASAPGTLNVLLSVHINVNELLVHSQ